MYESSRQRVLAFALVAGLLVLAVVPPAEAQRDFEPLFDKFNLSLEGSWIGISTQIRLDSETLGEGTTLSFEDDLGLSKGEAVPTLAFEWQFARKHRLGVRWQDFSRGSSAQALTEIHWGDEVIPIDAGIALAFDTQQAYIDYTYFPWVKDEWAAGFGLGLRVMDISATLRWEEEIIGEGGNNVKGTAPLPYLYFEYRRLFSERWRFMTGLGWLYVKIEDIKGGQWLAKASIEYLLGEHWGFGAGINISQIDVEWKGLEDREGNPELTAKIDLDLNDFSVFARFRF